MTEHAGATLRSCFRMSRATGDAGARQRESAVYKGVHEHFELPRNAAMASAVVFETAFEGRWRALINNTVHCPSGNTAERISGTSMGPTDTASRAHMAFTGRPFTRRRWGACVFHRHGVGPHTAAEPSPFNTTRSSPPRRSRARNILPQRRIQVVEPHLGTRPKFDSYSANSFILL